MLELLNGSAGGKWLDISATGLKQVGYVRFSVSADLDPLTRFNFELDAVSIARGTEMGAPTVPEPATLLLVAMTSIGLAARFGRRRSS